MSGEILALNLSFNFTEFYYQLIKSNAPYSTLKTPVKSGESPLISDAVRESCTWRIQFQTLEIFKET